MRKQSSAAATICGEQQVSLEASHFGDEADVEPLCRYLQGLVGAPEAFFYSDPPPDGPR